MVAAMIVSLVFVILSLTVNVNSQTCNNATQYSACSLNSQCGCLSFSFSDSWGVCGLLNQSCSQFASCQSPNDACVQPQHICVRHPRCSSTPVCYPLSSIDQSACPIRTVSNYTSGLTIDDGRYARPSGSGSGYYYEAIRVVVDRTGTYNIASLSGYDTHGYLYNGTFYPLSPSTNLTLHDDDSGGNAQFKLTTFLEAGVPYTLVVTTHSPGITGPFSVVATGPGNAQFYTINPMDLTTTTTTTTLPPIITTSYSNALTVNSQNFSRNGSPGSFHYYQAIEVRVPTTGSYTFRTSSTIGDTYGYLYQGNFYPTSPSINLIAQDDDSAGNLQFQITATLRSDITYILVYTTLTQGATGSFNIVATGPGDVYFNPITSTI
jgi:hypothetical protein